MRFTHLKLENWRNFTTVDVPLAERVFVVGANASGKSNLLDVFRFLQEIAQEGGGLANAFDGRRRGLRAVRSLHSRRNHLEVDVCAEIDGHEWRYLLRLGPGKPGKKNGATIIQREFATRDGKTVLDRPDPPDSRDEDRLKQTALEQTTQNKDFRELVRFLASVEYTHVVPQLVRDPRGGQDRERFGEALGADFVEQIARTKTREKTARLKVIQKALRSVLPQFSELVDDRDDVGRPHLKAKYLHWRPPGAWQQEDQFSDGTLRLIGLLWHLSAGSAPLLLEEPELSLHPSAVRQLPRMLASVAARTGRQVLLSTHSPDLLADKGIEPAEVLLLAPTKEATCVTVGSDDEDVVRAAEADLSLGPIVEAKTRPKDVLALASFGAKG